MLCMLWHFYLHQTKLFIDFSEKEHPSEGGGEVTVLVRVTIRTVGLRLPLPQHVERGVCLHDLAHGLVDEDLAAGEPVAEGGVEVVGEVHGHHTAGGRGVDAHVVRRVVEELATGVPLDVVSVVVTPWGGPTCKRI